MLIFSTHIALYLTKSDREYTVDELRLDAKKFGPALASVTTIQGHPAEVFKANGAGQGNVGSVETHAPPLRRVVMGYQSPNDLIQVAQSLRSFDPTRTATACS